MRTPSSTARPSVARRAAAAGAALIAVAAGGVIATPAFAAGETVTFSPTSVASGRSVVFGGTGWRPLDTVNFSLSGPASGFVCQLRANSAGTIPDQACAISTFFQFGQYTVTGTSTVTSNTKNATGKLSVTPTTTATNPSGSVVISAAAGNGMGVFGSGFAPSSAVKVRVDGTNVPTTPATPVTNTNGSVSGITFTLPAATTAGAHIISIRDGANHVADYTITVYRPTVSIGAGPVAAGQPVAVTGDKWPAGDFIQLFLTKVNPPTNAFMCQVRADSTGKITPNQTCNAPPNIIAGVYTLTANDVSRYASVTGGNVTLEPSISLLTPSFQPTLTAAAGTAVLLTGGGYGNAKKITATVNGVAAPTTPTLAKSGANGTVSNISITIPAATPAGARDVVVSDSIGNTATTTVQVYKPTLTVSPASAAAGTPLTVAGDGWPAGDLVSVQLTSAVGTATICNVPVDSTGVLSTPGQQCFAPGNLPFGTYSVFGSSFQRYVQKTGANFNLSSTINLTNSGGTPIASGTVGDTVFVSGNGFTAGSSFTVKFNGVNRPTTPASPTTASNGSFSGVSFTVPSIANGTYVVTVRDSANRTATSSFTVT